jgi:HEAT repeat protein
MGKVLLLQEWQVEAIGNPISDIDRDERDRIADEFIKSLKESIGSGDPARSEAAASLAAETAASTRTLGTGQKAGFLRQRLTTLAPDLAKMAASPDPKVRQFAAEAIGNIQGDPKLTVRTLKSLLKDRNTEVRRTAAGSLANLIQVISQQEKRIRNDVSPAELRRDLMATGILVVPATRPGLTPDQPVEVRRLSADALQQVSTALLDVPVELKSADKYPTPGQPWTADQQKAVEDDRAQIAEKREELRPLLDAFAKESAVLTAASIDPDPYVRIQVRRVLQELAATRSRLNRMEASIPRGEGVPQPRPEPKPGEGKPPAAKTDGAFLPGPNGAPVVLVAQEKEKPAPAAKPGPELLGASLHSALPDVVAGLSDPNVRARIEAVGVLDSMGADAAPAIPALVKSLGDRDRFVRWSAARALGRLAPRSPELVVPAVARLLGDDDLDVEVAAATALERYGPAAKTAVAALGHRASHGDADIRIAAMKALEAVGADAAPALPAVALNLVAKTRAQREQEGGPEAGPLPPPKARAAAAETLGHFGKLAAGAVPVLQLALNDDDPEVRRAVSDAILRATGK